MVALYVRLDFAAKYGFGIRHITDDGKTALLDHGHITLIPREAYDRAAVLEWMGPLVCLMTAAMGLVVGIDRSRRGSHHGTSQGGEAEPCGTGVDDGFVTSAIGVIASVGGLVLFVLLALAFPDAAGTFRWIMRAVLSFTLLGSLFCLFQVWRSLVLEARIAEGPSDRNCDTALNELCRRHAAGDASVAYQMERTKWKRRARACLRTLAVLIIVYLVCL